jgi:peptidoglycan/xylan/chitin deacetylase (PgdA/CDA1 family)
MDSISPLGPVKVAITIDDFVLWDGTPLPEGESSLDVTKEVARVLNDHGQHGIYGFSHTYGISKDPANIACWEAWLEAGHHLGNHSHQHAPLRWMSADDFCRDLAEADRLIGHLIAQAPSRYFRYPMDMSSGSEAKRGKVEEFLHENGYRNAPITTWFSDFAWLVPFQRALINGDKQAQQRLQDLHVTAAVESLERHATAARSLFGTDMPYIWLIHGTPMAARTLGRIIEQFKARGVQFVTLDEAMRHPANFGMPPVSDSFSNHLQRFAIAGGLDKPDVSQELIGEVLFTSPIDGMDSIPFYDEKVLKPIADRVGSPYIWEWA